tara:strand:- start:458 stop:1465 length:1008 start_codon:yes stop_codon:yes gene_type:complete
MLGISSGLHFEGSLREFDPSVLDGLITWYDFSDHTFIEKANNTPVVATDTTQDLYEIKNKWNLVSTNENFPIDISGQNPYGYFMGEFLRRGNSNTIPSWENPSGLIASDFSTRHGDFTGVYDLGGGTNNGSRYMQATNSQGGGTSDGESISLDNFSFYIVFKQDVASPTTPDGGRQRLIWIEGEKSSSDTEGRTIALEKSAGAASGGGRYYLYLYEDGSVSATISAGSYTVDTSTKILGFNINSSTAGTSIGRMYQSGDGTYEDTNENGVATTMTGGSTSASNTSFLGSRGPAVQPNDPDRTFDGHMCEIVMYNRALTSGEQTELEEYFKDKWNI